MLRVLPLKGCDIILGKPWLSTHNPQIEWNTNTMRLRQPGIASRFHTITQAPQDYAITDVPGIKFISSGEYRSLQNDPRWLCYAISIHDPSEVDQPTPQPPPAILMKLQKLLAEYADVFPDDLPDGLPPSRTVDHVIELENGTTPPKLPMYRHSPREDAFILKTLKALLRPKVSSEYQNQHGHPRYSSPRRKPMMERS